MWKQIIALFAILVLVLSGIVSVAEASETASSIGYSVTAILPENQTDAKAAYFHLMIKPKQQQTLQVKISNKESQNILVAVEANAASTNANGVVEFLHSSLNTSAPVNFSEIVVPVMPEHYTSVLETSSIPSSLDTVLASSSGLSKTEQEAQTNGVVVSVPANGEVVAEFLLTAPAELFEGEVLGGLVFTKLYQTDDYSADNFAISNVYRYVIGVLLREQEEMPDPSFALNGVEVVHGDSSKLVIHLSNLAPLLARNISIQASVFSQNERTAALTFNREKVSMAPISSMDYAILLDNGASLASGVYRLSLTLQYAGNAWSYETTMVVSER